MKKYLIIGLVLLIFAACTPQPHEVEIGLANTKWTLVSFGEMGAETAVAEGSAIALEFDGKGQANGSGGCNSYSAQYEIQGNTLSFGPVSSTRMACEQEGIGQQEQSYFQALEAAGSYELDGERLTIWSGDGKVALNFIKA